MALKSNLVIDQGADYSTTIAMTGTNLTGYTVKSQVRKSYTSSDYFAFTTSHNGANGQITLAMSNTTTGSMEPGRYLYDVEISSPANKITRVAEGIVTVTPGITRD